MAGAAPEIDGHDGFDFFKTLWQGHEDGCHVQVSMKPGPNAHGFLVDSHVLVLGAGYVGGAVARAARQVGAHVAALTRNADRAHELRQSGISTVVADLASPDWHTQFDPGSMSYVLNCTGSGGGGVEGYRTSYFEGMQSILAWGMGGDRARVPHLVYTGSTSVYPADHGEWVTEVTPTAASSPEGEILLETESLLAQWPGRWTGLRLAGIYGPGRHYLLNQLRAGDAELAGTAAVRLNVVHRDDIVSAVFATWAHPEATAGQFFNVADDVAAPKGDVVAWLARQLGRDTPSFSGRITAGRRRQTPDRIIANERLKTATGWRPSFPSFREGYTALLGA